MPLNQRGRAPFLITLFVALAVALGACSNDPTDSPAGGSPDGTPPAANSLNVVNPAQTGSTKTIDGLTAAEIVAAQEQVLANLYEAAVPSVVRITTSQSAPVGSPFGPGFDFGRPDQLVPRGEGSGWVWDTDGHIVTNHHVVAGADRVTVEFHNRDRYTAEVIGTDPDSDLAVIKIDPREGLQPLPAGDSSALRVGQMAIAIGSPFGQDFTMTTGIVSALGRLIQSGFSDFSIPQVIQTDAAINPGNSGGPLMDREGRVIGINTQIRTTTGTSSGVGFAVPINIARQVIPALIEDGEYHYSYLGISAVGLFDELAEAINLDRRTRGVLVTEVRDGGPADTAGIRGGDRNVTVPTFPLPIEAGGDVITGVNGQPIFDMTDLIAFLAEHTRPGDTITFSVIRADGSEAEIDVILSPRPRR